MGLRRMLRLVEVRRGEAAPTALAFICFFALLAASSVLRPIREALGIEGGVYTLPVLWTGTFVATLTLYPALGALASRTTRTRFAAAVFATIAASLIVFRLLLAGDAPEVHVARAYYVWVSVFNVLLASVFWGVMADVFSNEQGRRLFGAIAAGGTAGAVCGTAATRLLVRAFGVEGMLLVAAGLIALALVCVGVLSRGPRTSDGSARPPDPMIGGKVLDGLSHVLRSRYLLAMCAWILLLTSTATFVYFQQAWIVDSAISDREGRTEFFATVDLGAQGVTLIVQLLIMPWLVRRAGVTGLLIAVPLVTALGFGLLAVAPTLIAVAVFQVLRRASEYGLGRPAREILFTLVSRADKFKAKNVVDVVVYRGGDMVVAWINIGLKSAGLGLGALALAALPLCVLWAVTATALGRMEARRRAAAEESA
jgi:ATP:ADP antiporter, AAA family